MHVGRFALVMAGSGWLLLWLRLSHTALGLDLYCDWTRDCSALLWTAAPTYVAMLGIVAPAVPISLALHREQIGPRYLRAATLVTSNVALIVLALAIVATYDSMWSNYVGPFGLDVPRRTEILSADFRATTWWAWPPFVGAWMALTGVQLRAKVPAWIASIGSINGLALVASAPYGGDRFVSDAIMPLALILGLVWATAIGVYLSSVRRVTATA